jgi:hypothetical protein
MRGRRARKNRRRIRWNTLRIFLDRERRRCLQIVFRSRMVLLGQAPTVGGERDGTLGLSLGTAFMNIRARNTG